MKRNHKGFTLAELLVVVAIIAVLVAISIPIFTSQLHKAKVATDWANLRALYAEIQTKHLTDESDDDWSYAKGCKVSNSGKTITCSDQTVELEAGSIAYHTGDNSGYADDYYFIYVCDNGETDHMLLVASSGIQTFTK